MHKEVLERLKPIPIIDLLAEYHSLKAPIDAAVLRVLASGYYTIGEEVKRLEEEIAAYCQTRFAVGVNSGTDALLLALRALDIGPGDEVIVPAMTFIASAEPIVMLGARPVFADIDPVSYTLDPAQVRKRLSSRTKAIIAVHLYGMPADLSALKDIADASHVALIEDMAQAFGAEFQGQRVGSFGRMACISFYPTKNLGAPGDGGMILTSDESLVARLRRLRNHGSRTRYDHDEVGYNSRLDELQAAVLRVKLPMVPAWNQKRDEIAQAYTQGLHKTPLQLPASIEGRRHVYHLYTLCSPQRDALHGYLQGLGIHTAMHYPKPLHLQDAFKNLGGKPGDFPHSEHLSRETLSLPLYPLLANKDVQRVTKAVEQFFRQHD